MQELSLLCFLIIYVASRGAQNVSLCGCNSSGTDALCSVKVFVVCLKSVEETQCPGVSVPVNVCVNP